MVEIRPYQPGDLEALYDICLKTGEHGADASHLYAEPRLLGEIYAAPYATLEPELAFVAEDDQGVAGYILGAADTRAFEAACEARWWPRLREAHAKPGGTPSDWSRDQQRVYQLHRPFRIPDVVVDAAPAHLHIDLLPRLQGQGLGRRMMDTWLAAVGGKAHLGTSIQNARAIHFYETYGWREINVGDAAVWMTIG